MKKKDQLDILFEDDALVLINKPSGLLSIPDRYKPELANVKDLLDADLGTCYIVHRLDKDTSGLLCMAKTEEAHRHLSLQFEHRTVVKKYLALVEGSPPYESGEIDRPIGPNPNRSGSMVISKSGKAALTHYKVVAAFKAYSLLEVEIKTGRTHQIRVHLKAIGCPLAVDPIYHNPEGILLSTIKKRRSYQLGKEQEERPLMSRLSLHAQQLGFTHPVSNEWMTIEAPMHKDFRAVLQQLQKWSGG